MNASDVMKDGEALTWREIEARFMQRLAEQEMVCALHRHIDLDRYDYAVWSEEGSVVASINKQRFAFGRDDVLRDAAACIIGIARENPQFFTPESLRLLANRMEHAPFDPHCHTRATLNAEGEEELTRHWS